MLSERRLLLPKPTEPEEMIKETAIALFAAAMVTLIAAGCKPEAAPKTSTPKVLVITVSPRNVPIYEQWIGTLDGYPNAQIRAQVTGYLMKQDYAEGSRVKKGDLLFEIDARPFQAALDQALGKLAQDQAIVDKTDLDVKRYTPLAKEQALSQETLDDAIQANLGAKASVDADKAAVEAARLNLGWTKVTSPVDGIAGTATAQIGDLVGQVGPLLTTVSTVDPIRAYFNINEQFYLSYRLRHATPGRSDPAENEIPLELILSTGSSYPRKGKWLFTGRQVDPNTGTLQAAAEFENPENILRPGQYALVRAQIEMRPNSILIPQRCVTELQGSYQVATVGRDNKVQIKKVQVGRQVGHDWLIEDGLAPNERIVVEGLQKAKDGALVDPEPNAPTNQTVAAYGVAKPQ
jgi:membrane fusion protein (multidrug efflux system)